MNILALNWNDMKNPFGGGAELHLEELLRRLVTYGHEVTLFCSGWQDCLPEETVEGIHVIRRGNRYNFNLVTPFHLRSLVKKNQYDILLENLNKIPFYTPLYLKIKRLVLINHLFSTTVFQEANFLLGAYVYFFEKPLVPVYRGQKINVVSRSTADDVIERGIPESDVSIIESGIDRDVYFPDPSVPKYDVPTILYLGRIKKYKSIQHVISALVKIKEKLPDVRLMVVGAGDYSPKLKAQARTLGLADEVEFPGFVSVEEKVGRMRRAHVAVLPSTREGWGLTNTEANAVGTPSIAANRPGLRDSVSDGLNGFLYEYGDIDELAEKLMTVLQNDELRNDLERGALQFADRYSWDESARKLEKLLLEITELPV